MPFAKIPGIPLYYGSFSVVVSADRRQSDYTCYQFDVAICAVLRYNAIHASATIHRGIGPHPDRQRRSNVVRLHNSYPA